MNHILNHQKCKLVCWSKIRFVLLHGVYSWRFAREISFGYFGILFEHCVACFPFHCIACFIDVSFPRNLNLNGALMHPKMWVKEEKKNNNKRRVDVSISPLLFSPFLPPLRPFPSLFASLNKCTKWQMNGNSSIRKSPPSPT
jgi:hypothetical protein